MNGYSVRWDENIVLAGLSDSSTSLTTNRASSLKEAVLAPVPADIKLRNTNFISADSCDVLELKTAGKISVQSIVIGKTKIKYKKCGEINGAYQYVDKKDVISITYKDGTKREVGKNTKEDDIDLRKPATKPKVSGKTPALFSFVFGLVACVVGLLSAYFLLVLFANLAIFCGINALVKMKNNKERGLKKMFAVLGIILGVIALLALLFFIVMLLF